MPPTSEAFTFIETTKDLAKDGFHDYVDILSAKIADVDLQFSSRIRSEYPELIVTTVPGGNIDLILFANLGYASYEIDVNKDNVSRWRGYVPPPAKGGQGYLGEVINYAKYKYKFGDEYFIMYYVKFGYSVYQYILKEPRKDGETPNTNSVFTDKLLKAAGDVLYKQQPGIFVFDGYWYKDTNLYQEVQKSSWDKVILDEKMKTALTEVSERFFDSKDVYEDLGVPWKRGIIFYGPPGNGKTISIKALMRTLSERSSPIPTLYVKNAPGSYYIRNVFAFARQMSPCLLVLEDIETIVTPNTRSYFFNEVDGLANNDGILTVASTNYLDRLDPGLTKRPSRFDRKYLFPLPNEHERVLYAEFWRFKLKKNKKIDFPKKLCRPMAVVTEDFSFAYMQEAFIATLLEMARRGTDDIVELMTECTFDSGDEGLDEYLLWRVFREQAKILREDMDSGADLQSSDAFEAPCIESSQRLDVSALQMLMPGSFRPDLSQRAEMVNSHGMGKEDLARDMEAQEYFIRYAKWPLRNRAADEFRPYDDDLVWAKRS